MPLCFSAGVGARAHPVPVREVRGGGPALLAVEPPAALHLRGAQLHVRGVGAGLRLAVADRELDLAAHDLRQELALELLVAAADHRLADDADALARLRRAVARERLGQDEVVDARQLAPAVLLRPRHAEPAALGELLHERALGRRVHGLRELLGVRVHHLGRGILAQERLDLGFEGLLLGAQLEVHGHLHLSRRHGRPAHGQHQGLLDGAVRVRDAGPEQHEVALALERDLPVGEHEHEAAADQHVEGPDGARRRPFAPRLALPMREPLQLDVLAAERVRSPGTKWPRNQPRVSRAACAAFPNRRRAHGFATRSRSAALARSSLRIASSSECSAP